MDINSLTQGCKYFQTSAKTDINITESFEQLIRECRDTYKKKKRFSLTKLFAKSFVRKLSR
jgi:hypothetical protein